MAAIDDIFGSIPAQVLSQFGQNITYIKTTTPRTYNPTTGAVTGSDTNVTVKGVITTLDSNEDEGLYQTTDLKIVIGASELGDYYPTEADRVQYAQAGATREGKIISIPGLKYNSKSCKFTLKNIDKKGSTLKSLAPKKKIRKRKNKKEKEISKSNTK